MENKIGVKDDLIFLLSAEEYNQYIDKIPRISLWWWLRSPGSNPCRVACADYDSFVYYDGYGVRGDGGGVRPAIYVDKTVYDFGDKICVCGYTWIVIDKENGIAIAEMPIGVKKFDSKSNDYETSYIRKWLLDWYKERTEYFCEDQ